MEKRTPELKLHQRLSEGPVERENYELLTIFHQLVHIGLISIDEYDAVISQIYGGDAEALNHNQRGSERIALGEWRKDLSLADRIEIINHFEACLGNVPQDYDHVGSNILVTQFESEGLLGSHATYMYPDLMRYFLQHQLDRGKADKILEITSGSHGIILAVLCLLLGIECHVIAVHTPYEVRTNLLKRLAGGVTVGTEGQGIDGANAVLKESLDDFRSRGYWFTNHSHIPQKKVDTVTPFAQIVYRAQQTLLEEDVEWRFNFAAGVEGNLESLTGLGRGLAQVSEGEWDLLAVNLKDYEHYPHAVIPGVARPKSFEWLHQPPHTMRHDSLGFNEVYRAACAEHRGLSSQLVRMATLETLAKTQDKIALVLEYDKWWKYDFEGVLDYSRFSTVRPEDFEIPEL